MNLDITPEPTEEEKAAILAALADEEKTPAPAPWQEESPPDP